MLYNDTYIFVHLVSIRSGTTLFGHEEHTCVFLDIRSSLVGMFAVDSSTCHEVVKFLEARSYGYVVRYFSKARRRKIWRSNALLFEDLAWERRSVERRSNEELLFFICQQT